VKCWENTGDGPSDRTCLRWTARRCA
jgi:hypothetical protein